MVSFRSRRLETLLGAPLGEVRHAHVAGPVANHVSEAFDLDFKAALYERSDQAKRSLAADVAALANTAGGILVLGLRRMTRLAPSRRRRSRSPTRRSGGYQVIAALVAPLPVVDVVPVPADSGGDRFF